MRGSDVEEVENRAILCCTFVIFSLPLSLFSLPIACTISKSDTMAPRRHSIQ